MACLRPSWRRQGPSWTRLLERLEPPQALFAACVAMKKPMKNRSNIDSKSFKNLTKIDFGALLGRLEGRMGAHRVRAGHLIAF